jgi:hypothetical protein
MTEAEWDASDDPQRMLAFLRTTGRASDRKLRLFAVACCRGASRLFTAKAVRAAVETSERFADGQATAAELRDAGVAAARLAERGFRKKVRAMPWALVVQGKFARQAAVQVASADIDDVLDVVGSDFVLARTQAGHERGRRKEQLLRADLLRCLFGPLPFRRVQIKRVWRTTAVVTLSRAIYEERRFEDTPILADALEEVGCSHVELLAHLRGPGGHVRGCWVLDLLAARE